MTISRPSFFPLGVGAELCSASQARHAILIEIKVARFREAKEPMLCLNLNSQCVFAALAAAPS